ncbi:MAG TPA: transporter substrate-binding domain-containing protein [Usitatibacter sp.]|nr:transporter substrate-binding domain-containing protein [Usitatibacter sp.]
MLSLHAKSLLAAAALVAACAGAPSIPVADIAPTGTLRVAVAVGPSPSAFWATRDPATRGARGVTVELGKAAASKLGAPVQIVEYQTSAQITAAAPKGAWDLSFMPYDAERDKYVDVGPAYVRYATTYVVRAGSDIRTLADVDHAGVRVGAIEGTAISRTVAKALTNTKLTVFPTAEAAQAELAAGRLDALAQGRDALGDFARKNPGTRVLDEDIQSTGVVVVVPKGRAVARAWAARFMEDAKGDGTVRRALDSGGFKDTAVAPPEPRS